MNTKTFTHKILAKATTTLVKTKVARQTRKKNPFNNPLPNTRPKIPRQTFFDCLRGQQSSKNSDASNNSRQNSVPSRADGRHRPSRTDSSKQLSSSCRTDSSRQFSASFRTDRRARMLPDLDYNEEARKLWSRLGAVRS